MKNYILIKDYACGLVPKGTIGKGILKKNKIIFYPDTTSIELPYKIKLNKNFVRSCIK